MKRQCEYIDIIPIWYINNKLQLLINLNDKKDVQVIGGKLIQDSTLRKNVEDMLSATTDIWKHSIVILWIPSHKTLLYLIPIKLKYENDVKQLLEALPSENNLMWAEWSSITRQHEDVKMMHVTKTDSFVMTPLSHAILKTTVQDKVFVDVMKTFDDEYKKEKKK